MNEIVVAHRDRGETIQSISTRMGILRRQVERVFRESGVEIRTRSGIIHSKIPALDDEAYMRFLYFDKRMTIAEIAVLLGTNEQVIKTAMKRFGVTFRDTSAARANCIDREMAWLDLVEMYKTMSVVAIANQLGVSETTILNRLQKLGVQLRSLHEARVVRSANRSPMAITSAIIARRLRSRLSAALCGYAKSASTLKLTGVETWEQVVTHLESQFCKRDGVRMSWGNYGKMWHVDHIKPLAAFDLSQPDEQRKACHYSNLRPLWADENHKKSSKYVDPTKPTVYVIAGQSGVGKSWVCDQLCTQFEYIPYDKNRNSAYELIAKAEKSTLFDPTVRSRTHANKLRRLGYNVVYVVIYESCDVVRERLLNRGSTRLQSVDKLNAKYKRYSSKADFTGTAEECLSWLRSQSPSQPVQPLEPEVTCHAQTKVCAETEGQASP